MAGYQCGGCDGAEPAAILITPLNGAETLAIGENCMPVTWCGILAGVLGIDAEQLWDAAVALKAVAGIADDRGQAAADETARDLTERLSDPPGQPAAKAASAAADGKTTPPAARPTRAPRQRRTTK